MKQRNREAVQAGIVAVTLGFVASACQIFVGVEELSCENPPCLGAGGNSGQSSGANMDSSSGSMGSGSMSSSSTSGGSCSECFVGNWTQALSGTLAQTVDDMAISNSGKIAFTGKYSGETDFAGKCPTDGTCPLLNQGGNDAFVGMINADGSPLWSRALGDGAQQFGAGVAVDANENTIFVGSFQGMIEPNGSPITSAGLNDVFVVRFDSKGNNPASISFGGAANDFAHDVAVDGMGNIIVAGFFEGMFNCGNSIMANGPNDMFIVRLAATDLSCTWSKGFGATDKASHALAVAVDAQNNIILTGSFQGSINFGTETLDSLDGTDDLVVAKYASNGMAVWNKRFVCSGIPEIRAVMTDMNGNIYVTGSFTKDLAFGTGGMLTATDQDAFVAKLDANGNPTWSKSFGSSGIQSGESIAVAPNGHVFVTGKMDGTVSFGAGPDLVAEGSDVFVLHFDVNGNPVCGTRYGDSKAQEGKALVIDSGGNLILGTNYEGAFDMACKSAPAAMAQDVLFTHLTP